MTKKTTITAIKVRVKPAQPSFICPYCQSPLMVDAKTWRCDGSQNDKNIAHPFDVAREGYVNLLPVNSKKSKDPGDSAESIDARHRFLSQGYYQRLQQLVASLVQQTVAPPTDPIHSSHNIINNINISNSSERFWQQRKTWLDMGCGEGYYTDAVARALKNHSGQPVHDLIAVDISKPAVIQTSQLFKQRQQLWQQVQAAQDRGFAAMQAGIMVALISQRPASLYPIVASGASLPLADNSIGGISSIFSPILPVEFARVLKKDGRLIIAKPDTGHLQSVRDALFDEVRPHDSDKFLEQLAPYFELTNTHQVQGDLSLNAESLADLLTMTPYSYRAKLDKRKALLALAATDEVKTQARFVVYELVKV